MKKNKIAYIIVQAIIMSLARIVSIFLIFMGLYQLLLTGTENSFVGYATWAFPLMSGIGMLGLTAFWQQSIGENHDKKRKTR